MATNERDITLYHYSFSPYAKRIVWYLNLRGIPYTQCMQAPYLPRADISSLGTSYRRIPIVTIGRDVYVDTRLILRKLEELYPAGAAFKSIGPGTAQEAGTGALLSAYAIDGGLFAHASRLIPSDMPLMDDPKFTRDREDLTGRPMTKASLDRGRPEALVEIKAAFELFEATILGDGREWVLGGSEPTLADIEAIWPFHWLIGMKGALPPTTFSPTHFPRVFGWVSRFDQATRAAAATKAPKTTGAAALAQLGGRGFAEPAAQVDAEDALGLRAGETVEVWPLDSGSNHRDRGALIGLNGTEVVIAGTTSEGQEVRIHAPRHGFRVRRVGGEKL